MEHQHINGTYIVLDDDMDGSNGTFSALEQERDVAGGLDRNQIGELVYARMKLQCKPRYAGSSPETTPGFGQFELELTAPGESDFSSFANNKDVGVTDSDDIDLSASESVNDFSILFDKANCHGSAKDGTDVSSGNAEYRTVDIHLRDVYGRGPVFDNDEGIGLSAAVLWDSFNDTGLRGSFQVHLVWDIFEVEDSIYDAKRDVMGI